MPDRPLADEDARTLRGHWFRYLDTLEPLRPDLYGYCRQLTGSVWDAEDLVQETLLKGFAMTARGDFHGPDSPVRDVRAYLFRTATNGWIDTQRRTGRLLTGVEPTDIPASDPVTASDPVATSEAFALVRSRTTPAEFASLVLKDVYGFALKDIADFVGTTPGTVKSALHRARRKIHEDGEGVAQNVASESERALATAFAEALNAHDVDRILAMMAQELQIAVCNVGGGRGRSRMWTEPTVAARAMARPAELDGRTVVILLRDGVLYDVLRVTGSEQQLTRLTDYCYAPDVLEETAERLGHPYVRGRYHQGADILPRMIATTTLPWRTT